MKNIFAIIALLSLTATAYAKPGQITAADLVGVWKLIKSENPMPDGTTVSYCNEVHGYIIYTSEGYVSVSLNCGPQLNESEPANVSGRKFFYTGTYDVKGSEVTHHLENASDTQLIGSDSKRYVTFARSVLVLTGENQGQSFSAFWQKIR